MLDFGRHADRAIYVLIAVMAVSVALEGVESRPGKALGQFQTVHGIDCRNPDELVVSEIAAWRVQKIRLRAQPPQTASAR